MTDAAWDRLRRAARAVCDQRLLVHKAKPGTSPEALASAVGVPHHPECPACELREALTALDGPSAGGFAS